MTDNVVDATARFSPQKDFRTKPLDALRNTVRTATNDRALLAQRLGEIASQIAPNRPSFVAKGWFEKAWNGDRWAKRKRYICFPGETAPTPSDDSNYVASGADWAALIDQAVKSLHPGDGAPNEAERHRAGRDILRGTTFLPDLPPLSSRSESVQQLLISLAQKAANKIENDSDLCRLWSALQATPLSIESYDLEIPTVLPSDSTAVQEWTKSRRHADDNYARSSLGAASRVATEMAAFTHYVRPNTGFRFERTGSKNEDWPHPTVFLGHLKIPRTTRMFVIPQNFTQDLPALADKDDLFAFERVFDWLNLKGLMQGKKLPEILYNKSVGYGWRPYPYDLAQKLWLEVRQKTDGTPGLWLSSEKGYEVDFHFYPHIAGLDVFALARGVDFLRGIVPEPYDTDYSYIEWPTDNASLMVNGRLPWSAASGLVEIDFEDLPDTDGWIDDPGNADLQDLLLHNVTDSRFSPVFPISDVPPPGQLDTVAAALILNAGCEAPEERISRRLLHQAQTISKAGLGFHDALLSHHRAVIESM
jgi:hypothetical protein